MSSDGAASNGLDWPGFRVLFWVSLLGPLEPREIATLASASRASVSSALNTLERNGFVTRSRSSTDRRPGDDRGGAGGGVAWTELNPLRSPRPTRLTRAEDLESALRMARGYLGAGRATAARTSWRLRCLSRLGKPLEAEPFYQMAWPLDHEDSHIRAYALVLNNLRGPAILAYRRAAPPLAG